MISDEVMAGFGRCGEWFAVDHWNVVPDLITFAKGVNSGYVPLGGVIASDAIARTFDHRVYPGGLTYSGHLLACASAAASIKIFREENVIENVRELGDDVIGPGLRALAETPSQRGRRAWAGCVLGSRTGDRSPNPGAVGALQCKGYRCRARALIHS